MVLSTVRESGYSIPLALEEDIETNTTSASESEIEDGPPVHPVPTMQGAFEESMAETMNADEADDLPESVANADSATRRKMLLEQEHYQRTVAGRWKQKSGEKFHPLWKLVAQISFGMHLLQQGLAKSDEEVLKILQTHVDEIDGFLERTTEDFDLALGDINERIRYLKLPLDHGDVFDQMLADRAFRTAIVEGNEKIEHIIDRTAAAMNDALKDVQKGLDATRELAKYMTKVDKMWEDRSEEHDSVYLAMIGNTEGWTRAFLTLQSKGSHLRKGLVQLGSIVSEMQRRAGTASRKHLVPQRTPTSKHALDGKPQSPGAHSITPPRSPNKPLPSAPDASGRSTHHHSQRHRHGATSKSATNSPHSIHPSSSLSRSTSSRNDSDQTPKADQWSPRSLNTTRYNLNPKTDTLGKEPESPRSIQSGHTGLGITSPMRQQFQRDDRSFDAQQRALRSPDLRSGDVKSPEPIREEDADGDGSAKTPAQFMARVQAATKSSMPTKSSPQRMSLTEKTRSLLGRKPSLKSDGGSQHTSPTSHAAAEHTTDVSPTSPGKEPGGSTLLRRLSSRRAKQSTQVEPQDQLLNGASGEFGSAPAASPQNINNSWQSVPSPPPPPPPPTSAPQPYGSTGRANFLPKPEFTPLQNSFAIDQFASKEDSSSNHTDDDVTPKLTSVPFTEQPTTSSPNTQCSTAGTSHPLLSEARHMQFLNRSGGSHNHSHSRSPSHDLPLRNYTKQNSFAPAASSEHTTISDAASSRQSNRSSSPIQPGLTVVKPASHHAGESTAVSKVNLNQSQRQTHTHAQAQAQQSSNAQTAPTTGGAASAVPQAQRLRIVSSGERAVLLDSGPSTASSTFSSAAGVGASATPPPILTGPAGSRPSPAVSTAPARTLPAVSAVPSPFTPALSTAPSRLSPARAGDTSSEQTELPISPNLYNNTTRGTAPDGALPAEASSTNPVATNFANTADADESLKPTDPTKTPFYLNAAKPDALSDFLKITPPPSPPPGGMTSEPSSPQSTSKRFVFPKGDRKPTSSPPPPAIRSGHTSSRSASIDHGSSVPSSRTPATVPALINGNTGPAPIVGITGAANGTIYTGAQGASNTKIATLVPSQPKKSLAWKGKKILEGGSKMIRERYHAATAPGVAASPPMHAIDRPSTANTITNSGSSSAKPGNGSGGSGFGGGSKHIGLSGSKSFANGIGTRRRVNWRKDSTASPPPSSSAGAGGAGALADDLDNESGFSTGGISLGSSHRSTASGLSRDKIRFFGHARKGSVSGKAAGSSFGGVGGSARGDAAAAGGPAGGFVGVGKDGNWISRKNFVRG